MGTSGWSAKASLVRGNSARPERTASGGEDRTEGEAVPYQAESRNLPRLEQDPAERDHRLHRSSFDAKLHHIEMQSRRCGTFEPTLGAIGISRFHIARGLAKPHVIASPNRLASTDQIEWQRSGPAIRRGDLLN
jgi:hypothetical protein